MILVEFFSDEGDFVVFDNEYDYIFLVEEGGLEILDVELEVEVENENDFYDLDVSFERELFESIFIVKDGMWW